MPQAPYGGEYHDDCDESKNLRFEIFNLKLKFKKFKISNDASTQERPRCLRHHTVSIMMIVMKAKI